MGKIFRVQPPRRAKHIVAMFVAAAVLVGGASAPASAEDVIPGFGFGLPSTGIDMWQLGPTDSWTLVESGYTLADVDPLSGINMGTSMTDALGMDAATSPIMMDAGMLALDSARLAEAARLESVAKQQKSGKLKAGAVPAEYASLLEAAAATCPGLPVEILAAQIEAESNWNPRAVSPAGAQGLAQFMPGTWAAYGSGDPFNPADAIAAAARYDCVVLESVKSIPGDPISNMLAGYNAGPGAVKKFQGIPPYAETQKYVAKILARAPQLLADGTDDSSTDDSPVGMNTSKSLDGHQNGRIPASAMCDLGRGSGHMLRCDATEGFKKLDAAYTAHFGSAICITDSYRSYESQVRLKRTKGRMAATPGTSNHGWGLAVDLGCGINKFGSTQHRWMQDNAGRYGWVHPNWAKAGGSLPEAWHWEFGRIS